MNQKTPLQDTFDFDKVQLKEKEKIRELLYMANRILIHLGVGYFHQVYRRAFYYELKTTGVDFDVIKEVSASYRNRFLRSKEVNFFIIGDLLLSVVAVQELHGLLLLKFRNYIKHLKCKRGLIFNFNAVRLNYRYFEL